MSIYQFLIAVRQNGENLTNENGETTSHLMGMFYRTIRMIENGIKPVYVFDGKPPQLKSKELEKRLERRTEAQAEMSKAADAGKSTYDINEKFIFLIQVMNKHLINSLVELLKLLVNILMIVSVY
jgi:flap endonuclease-1